MGYQVVCYSLCDIKVNMVEFNGVLYATTPQLEKVFGVTRHSLNRLVRSYPQEFTQRTVGDLTANNVIRKELTADLGIKRLRKNTHLWSEDDLIGITWLIRSDIARRCRAEFKEILKQHARRDTVTKDQLSAMIQAEVHAAVSAVHEELMPRLQMLEDMNDAFASSAGKSLNARRKLKSIPGGLN